MASDKNEMILTNEELEQLLRDLPRILQDLEQEIAQKGMES